MADDVSRFDLTYSNMKAWCERQKYAFRTNDALEQIAVDYALLGQPAPLMILPQLGRGMVVLVMRQPFVVPPERRSAVIEACNQLNVTSFMGAWSLNSETGEVFFRATLVAVGNAYSDEGFLHAARVVVGTSEKAAPAMKSIALDGAEPNATIRALTPTA